MLEQAKALQDRVNITIIHIDADPDLKTWFLFSREIIEGFEVSKISFRKLTKKNVFRLNAIFYGLCVVYLLLKERKKYRKADINHVHVLTRTAVLPYFIKFFYNVPYVITEHWSRYFPENNGYHGFFKKIATKFLVSKSNGLATVSKALKQSMDKFDLFHQNALVISNAIDTEKYNIVMAPPNEKFLILHVSGLNDGVKNVTGILRAVKILSENGKNNFEMVIVGDDEIEGPVIRKYAADLGLSNVEFTGKLYGNALLSYYQKANVFVLNSNFETQSCVVLEAMSCGLPVIATKVGGVPEIMTSETGILINPKDDSMLVLAISKMIDNEVSFHRSKIRKHAVDNFGYTKVAEMIMSFYKKAIE
ncbi:glycosyltransferase [Pedobacter sp. SL55]|uniref:glycosyltransferase n=1 Tax=Pedobacter sp. SL55 TaxID=2995161 RepID=UPI0022713419|nr:glycosyltransferase [Pedobacter sp. SL55]WAC40324.1 glycosyltransferase [Pedobacter sp. SL55]